MGGETGSDDGYIDISFDSFRKWWDNTWLQLRGWFLIRTGFFEPLGIGKRDDPRLEGESWAESIWRVADARDEERKKFMAERGKSPRKGGV